MNRRSCHESPTKHFVHKLIDWDRVNHRLERYAAIRDAFSMEVLRAAEESPPYYCHYMAWRLGTWRAESEGCLANLDNLLDSAAELPNWENEESVLKNPEYATYWSLLWQLQVAARLRVVGRNVTWGGPDGGPDLSVDVNGQRWHVECNAKRKSYHRLQFLQECLSKILRTCVQVDYPRFSPMSLPGSGRFLDPILEPYCGASRREEVVERSWRSRCRPGSPSQHVRTMLREAVNDKCDKNQPTFPAIVRMFSP